MEQSAQVMDTQANLLRSIGKPLVYATESF